jgi:hypothetical protein
MSPLRQEIRRDLQEDCRRLAPHLLDHLRAVFFEVVRERC